MKIKKFILIAILPVLALFACTTPKTEDPTPRELEGVFKYTGATYSPIHFNAPYRYAVYNINGGFIAYVDTTRLVMASTNSFIDNVVLIKGAIVKEDGNNIVRAEHIRLKR